MTYNVDAVAIEKNIAPPAENSSRRGVWQRLLDRMEENDSVLLSRVQSYAFQNTAKNQGKRVTTRKEGDYVRVWYLGLKK